jgi:hypothetical protein
MMFVNRLVGSHSAIGTSDDGRYPLFRKFLPQARRPPVDRHRSFGKFCRDWLNPLLSDKTASVAWAN